MRSDAKSLFIVKITHTLVWAADSAVPSRMWPGGTPRTGGTISTSSVAAWLRAGFRKAWRIRYSRSSTSGSRNSSSCVPAASHRGMMRERDSSASECRSRPSRM